MRFTNWLYNYLAAHDCDYRNDPYWENEKPWSPIYSSLWRWLFKDRIALEMQVGKLTLLLRIAYERATRTNRTASMLVTLEKQGEVGFNEALQLVGLLDGTDDEDPYKKFYPKSDSDYSNQYASMDDETFSLLTGFPTAVVGKA